MAGLVSKWTQGLKYSSLCSCCYRPLSLLKTPNLLPRHISLGRSLSLSPKKEDDDRPKKGLRLGLLSKFFDLPSKDATLSSKVHGDESSWITVYRFPHITLCRVIQRMKIYQTVVCVVVLLPVGTMLWLQGVLAPEWYSFLVAFSGFSCVFLYIMGDFARNVVGIMYVTDKDPEIVRIAHLTFWGNRQDEVYMKSDLVPLGDLPDKAGDVYVKLRLYSDPEMHFKMSLKYGRIYDDERFFDIFGRSPDFHLEKKETQAKKQ